MFPDKRKPILFLLISNYTSFYNHVFYKKVALNFLIKHVVVTLLRKVKYWGRKNYYLQKTVYSAGAAMPPQTATIPIANDCIKKIFTAKSSKMNQMPPQISALDPPLVLSGITEILGTLGVQSPLAILL